MPTSCKVEVPDLIDVRENAHARWKSALLLGLGSLFLVLGMVGWLVPVVTGVPFYVIGLVLLGTSSRRVARWINVQERRLPPRTRRWLRQWKARFES